MSIDESFWGNWLYLQHNFSLRILRLSLGKITLHKASVDVKVIWNEFLNLIRGKQPSRGVLKKRCSENIQQIYRRIPLPKLKLLFGIFAVLQICCIFSEHLFLGTPLEDCSWIDHFLQECDIVVWLKAAFTNQSAVIMVMKTLRQLRQSIKKWTM